MRVLDKKVSPYQLFLIATGFLFFLLRLPSLFEPYWYGDEGVYDVAGMAIRSGRLLYKDIWDNKPPILYLLYALFSSDQFTIRLVSLLIGLFSVGVFYFLAKKLFTKRSLVFLSTLLFAILFGLPILEGNIANAENFMLLPILLAGYFVVIQNTLNRAIPLVFAGVLLSFAFLIKIVAVFDFGAFFLFLLFFNLNLNTITSTIKKLFFFSVSFSLPILVTILYFVFRHAFTDFIHSIFLQNVGYVGYGNTFLIPQGFLILKVLLLFVCCLFIFLRRGVYPPSMSFILLWVSFSLFNAFFSMRPWTHYLLVLLPSGILFITLLCDTGRLSAKERASFFLLLVVILFLIAKSFWIYSQTVTYYQNFLSFIFGQKSVSSYHRFFGQQVTNDYDVSEFFRQFIPQTASVFVWGNDAQLYRLLNKLPPGRYTVAYHILASKETLAESARVFVTKQPTFVILTGKDPFPFSLSLYHHSITIADVPIYERTR